MRTQAEVKAEMTAIRKERARIKRKVPYAAGIEFERGYLAALRWVLEDGEYSEQKADG